MHNLSTTDRSTATKLVEINRLFFAWLIEPLARTLSPYRHNAFVRNIPNGISVVRCLVAAWANWQIYQATSDYERWFYLGVIAILIISDGIDGELARRLKIESPFGARADPFADKILIGGLVIGLGFKFGSQPFTWLVIVLLVIEFGNVLAGYIGGRIAMKLNHPERLGASKWGKLKFGGECLLVLIGWTLLPYKEIALGISLLLIIMVIPLALRSLRGYIRKIQEATTASESAHFTVV